jgi:phosphatidate cytidylyltransferase
LISSTRIVLGSLLTLVIAGLIVLDLQVFERATLTIAVAIALGLLGSIECLELLRPSIPKWTYRGSLASAVLLLLFPGALLFAASLCNLWPLLLLLPLLPALGLCMDRHHSVITHQDLTALSGGLLTILFAALPMSCLAAILSMHNGLLLAAVLILGSKLNDIGGYLMGSAFGKVKLAPGISPGKTWLGSISGLTLGTAGAALLFLWLRPMGHASPSLPILIVFGFSIGVVTQIGDLTESVLKRTVGVKDSGRLLPAFGGMLDLIDSLIFAAPAGFAWFHLMGAHEAL